MSFHYGSRYQPSRSSISGSQTLDGTFYHTGNYEHLGDTTQIGDTIQTGSYYLSGNIEIDSSNLIIGTVASCSSGRDVYGIETQAYPSASLNIVSSRENGVGNISIHSLANVGVASINENHIIQRFGYKDNLGYCTGSWDIKNKAIESVESSSVELYGTNIDGSDVIAVTLGSQDVYSITGAKLLSITNGSGSGSKEREYVNLSGSRVQNISNYGGYTGFTYKEEAITVISGAYTDSTIYIPAGAVCYGVGVRVLNDVPISGSTFPSSSWFSVGISASVGSFTEKWGNGLSTLNTTTNLTSSMKAGFAYYNTDTPIRLSFDHYVSDLSASQGSGSVRVEIRYMQVIPPTS